MLTEPLLKLTPRLGSQSAYTLSLRPFLLERLLVQIDKVGDHIPEIVAQWKLSLYQRLAPLSVLAPELKLAPDGVVMPAKRSDAWHQAIAGDEITNAAMWLDPATSSRFYEMGGNTDDFISYSVRVLMAAVIRDQPSDAASSSGVVDELPASKRARGDADAVEPPTGGGDTDGAAAGGGGTAAAAAAGAGAGGRTRVPAPPRTAAAATAAPPTLPPAGAKPAVVVSQFTSYEDEKTHIDSLKRGMFEKQDDFNERKRVKHQEARKRWGKTASGPRNVDPTGGSEAWLEAAFQDALQKEVAVFTSMRDKWPVGKYGDPFAPYGDVPEVSGRYEWWPSVKEQLPLHNFLAGVILCSPATSTANESFHSVAEAILRKQRTRLTHVNSEFFALARVLLPKAAKLMAGVKLIEEEALEAGFLCEMDVEALLETLDLA
jgi:hypothetical protein